MSSTAFRTSSKTGSLYFAYGSNLSPTQMEGRCPGSAKPLALAKLNSYHWIITQRGAANVIPMAPLPAAKETDASTIWGILFNLIPEDETALDLCEGWDESRSGPANPRVEERAWKPYEQGETVYNKLYLPIKIEKWFIQDPKETLGVSEEELNASIVRTLIYVDEKRLIPGRIMTAYLHRMGRAARECVELGVPQRWVDRMLGAYGISGSAPESYTDDVMPRRGEKFADKDKWEVLRQGLLENENA